MIKIFTYFVEPASYTHDLIKNVYRELLIKYAFISDKSEAYAEDSLSDSYFLSNKSIFKKINFLYRTWRSHDLIIINGYNNYVFLITFIINFFAIKKRYIAIESDTQLKIPSNMIKRALKSIYLNVIFRDLYIIGFAGGSLHHKNLFRHYGMMEDRIFMLPMMIDNKKYYKEKIIPENFTFLFVGRLLDSKNVNILCERFISSFSDKKAKLLIVGDGDNLWKYKKKYIHKNIKFTGSVFGDELIQIYQNASVFVFPSSIEAWGLVINEAMSSALPVIAHKEVGAVYDLISEKNTGFIINDWDQLEEKMMLMYDDRDLCMKYSHNALQLMKTYWNYNLYRTNLLDSINKISKWISEKK